jgi:hypothetical protein
MSGTTQERMSSLFQAARQDGPTPEARVAMWTGIEVASISMGASGGTLAAAKAAIASSKLVLGLVLGATLTLGAAGVFVVMHLTQSPGAAPTEMRTVGTPRSLAHDDGLTLDEQVGPVGGVRAPVVIAGRVAPSDVVELGPSKKDNHAERAGTTTLSEHDRLALEARMVSEARGALHRGDTDLALRIVRAARTSPGARMVPEELTVESQALRVAGDEAGAKRVEADLATRFPDHSLSH